MTRPSDQRAAACKKPVRMRMTNHMPGFAAMALAISSAFGAAQAADPVPSQFEYDANGNLTKVTDPLGRVTNHQYDLQNQRTSTLAPPPAAGASRPAIGLGYDGQGYVKSVQDPKSLSTNYTRDGLGNVKSAGSPDTGTTRFTYDAAGNVKASTDARGVKVTYTYDGLNRLTQADYSDGTSSQAWRYDEGASGVGRLTSTGDLAGASWVVWTYDSLGQVTSRKQVTGTDAAQRTFLTLYKYGETGNAVGKVELLTYPSGAKYSYTYGADGQIQLIAQEDGSLLLIVGKRQPFGGAPMVMADGNGNTVYRDFDLQGRMRFYTREQGQALLDWDDANRLKTLTNPDVPARNESYEYDDLDRLTNWLSATAAHAYTYDGSGDRLTHSINANTRNYTYKGTNHRLVNLSKPAQARSYDAAGHMTGDGTRTYTYDGRGRLIRVTQDTIVTDYVINALGQRVKKSSTNAAIGTRHFVYNDDGQLLGEYDAEGTPIQEYVYADEHLVAVIKFTGSTKKSFWVESDHLGTPRVLKDKNKQVRWRWESDPYGMLPPQEQPTSGLPSVKLNLRMPGQYFDAESGLFYNGNRDYEAGIGRYVQSDPIGLAGGINTYAYVDGNPLSLSDPSGLDPWYRDAPWEEHPFFTDNADRQRIADVAKELVRSTDWRRWKPNPTWKHMFKFKCNIFVDHVLGKAGKPPGLAPNGKPWLADDWYQGRVPGYSRVPSGFVRPGDIAAQSMPGHSGYTGHVGVVVGGGKTVSQSSHTDDVDESEWGFRPEEKGRIRYYRCDCQK